MPLFGAAYALGRLGGRWGSRYHAGREDDSNALVLNDASGIRCSIDGGDIAGAGQRGVLR